MEVIGEVTSEMITALLNQIAEQAQRDLEENKLRPLSLLITDYGAIPLSIKCGSEEEKGESASLIRFSAKMIQSFGYRVWGIIVVVNADQWEFNDVSRQRMGDALGIPCVEVDRRVEKDPDFIMKYGNKRRCVLVSIESYFGDQTLILNYTKAEDGHVLWDPPEHLRELGNDGRLANLLPPLSSGTGAN